MQEFLDKKILNFKTAYLENYNNLHRTLSYNLSKEDYSLDSMFKRFDELIFSLSSDAEIEYVIKNIIEYLNEQEYIQGPLENVNNAFNQLSKIVELGTQEKIFKTKIDLIVSYLIKFLDNNNIKYNNDYYTNKEFESLKDKLYEMSEAIYNIQTNQNAAHEVIYNSIQEIHEELVKGAEKSRIFGKQFVKEQLAGKIAEMAITGGIKEFIHQISSTTDNETVK